jgi:serine/threonine protein kinase
VKWSRLLAAVCLSVIIKLYVAMLGISESSTKSILLSVAAAVEFMHGEGLVHRNLKAENILIFSLDDLSKVGEEVLNKLTFSF